ncbi:related to epoxide hydrolase [Claviceps purpurea 20.1]|uniref:Related to epoxide hydrolase n=1 Tax=Claviceps purpurea (strain 20.1) TaxID=1111077 RepID=M1W6B1_CLAP2|nr:hypothetical protein E4U12_003716 [Claviceps purpurea]CCE27773.1 related to epoxide hydrolase [Claviceps purpurea 20.1]
MAVSPEPTFPLAEEEIKLYTIHISSKYLNLTRQKLQLTRLPRNGPQPHRTESWEPKATVERLVDYWLQNFSWRDQEADLNANVPQFRTEMRTSSTEAPVRLHLIHSRSTYANAVPCLLIPPFPFTNLCLSHLINIFTTPDDPSKEVPFHLVIPSLPGLGFSDPINSNEPILPLIAQMFDALMKRLGYDYYLASTATPSPNSVTDIDFRLTNHIASSHPDSCLGVHLLSPPFRAPTWQNDPLEWLKWKTAAVLQTPCLGYTHQDVIAFQQQQQQQQIRQLPGPSQPPLCPGLNMGVNGGFEPNSLAYALCDSPASLLLFILVILRNLGPEHEFSNRDVIKMVSLTWLPGPEETMRLWANCCSSSDDLSSSSLKPKVGVTIFSGANSETRGNSRQRDSLPLPVSSPGVHTCLAWGRSRFNIVSSQTVAGSPGLLAWDRPEVIVKGVRELAKAIIASDDRLQAAKEPGVAMQERIAGLDEGDERFFPVDLLLRGGGAKKLSSEGEPTPLFPILRASCPELAVDHTDRDDGSQEFEWRKAA